MTEREILRKEHSKRLKDGVYEKELGHTCVNCGATENIEYHHIVPLCVGGTNKLTNIVPVCNRCHKAIHGEKDYREYKISQRKGKRQEPDSKSDEIIRKYTNCEISQSELKILLGIGGALNNNKAYKNYLASHGIKKVINNIDKLVDDLDYPPPTYKELGYVVYTSGEVKSVFYNDIH